MQAVILAGGLGTRMRPYTDRAPKSLLPVNGRPFIDYQLDLLKAGGVTDVVLCVGYLGEQIETHLGDGQERGLHIRYSRERDHLLGTAGSLKHAEPLLASTFIITWGDSYVRVDYRALFESHVRNPKVKATMCVFHNRGLYDASNVHFAHNEVVRYAKGSHDPALTHIDAGVSVLNKTVLDDIPANTLANLDDLFALYAKAGQLAGYLLYERFYEIGSKSGYREFEEFIKN